MLFQSIKTKEKINLVKGLQNLGNGLHSVSESSTQLFVLLMSTFSVNLNPGVCLQLLPETFNGYLLAIHRVPFACSEGEGGPEGRI